MEKPLNFPVYSSLMIATSSTRAAAAEPDHPPHGLLLALKDRLHPAIEEVPDPPGDACIPGLVLHGPPEPDTLYPPGDQHARPHLHIGGFGDDTTYLCRGFSGALTLFGMINLARKFASKLSIQVMLAKHQIVTHFSSSRSNT